MPCHPARARELLNKGRSAVYRKQPFTIILQDREGGDKQAIALKVDPGSKTTGLALTAQFKRGLTLVWAANLEHRGSYIKERLDKRRAVRRGRRNRNMRYRPPRFLNRTKPKGWLPPSLQSRVDNVEQWGQRLSRLIPLKWVEVETVRFDMQKMDNQTQQPSDCPS